MNTGSSNHATDENVHNCHRNHKLNQDSPNLSQAERQGYEAKEIGLVSEVCQPEELPARVRDLAQRISEKAPLAVQAAKAAVLAGLRSGPSVGYVTESEAFAFLCGTQDRNEGMDAFKERRKQRQFTGT